MRQRIAMLDCARGIAILGILLMNVTAFGLPKAAYLNPAYAGSITRGEAWIWAALDTVAQVKFPSPCSPSCLAVGRCCCYRLGRAGSAHRCSG